MRLFYHIQAINKDVLTYLSFAGLLMLIGSVLIATFFLV